MMGAVIDDVHENVPEDLFALALGVGAGVLDVAAKGFGGLVGEKGVHLIHFVNPCRPEKVDVGKLIRLDIGTCLLYTSPSPRD